MCARHSVAGAGHIARLRGELQVPMYRDAYALMLNTIVNSGLGLLYWIVAARTSSPEDVGRGNALISLMLLVSVLTQVDFGQALIRFLPRAGAGTRRLVLVSYGIAIGLAVLGGTLGQGRAAAAALEGISRNPGAAPRIQTPMILGLALMESLVLFAFAIAFLLQSKIV